jgi:hypothetical protein
LWIALTSKPRNDPPWIPSPVSKLLSAMKPKTPASSSERPASRQYHCAGVRALSCALGEA